MFCGTKGSFQSCQFFSVLTMLTSSLLTVLSFMEDIWNLELELLRLFIFKLTNSKNFWAIVGTVKLLWGFYWNCLDHPKHAFPRLNTGLLMALPFPLVDSSRTIYIYIYIYIQIESYIHEFVHKCKIIKIKPKIKFDSFAI